MNDVAEEIEELLDSITWLEAESVGAERTLAALGDEKSRVQADHLRDLIQRKRARLAELEDS